MQSYRFKEFKYLVRLEARGPNAEGEGAVTIRDLIKSALGIETGSICCRRSKRRRDGQYDLFSNVEWSQWFNVNRTCQ